MRLVVVPRAQMGILRIGGRDLALPHGNSPTLCDLKAMISAMTREGRSLSELPAQQRQRTGTRPSLPLSGPPPWKRAYQGLTLSLLPKFCAGIGRGALEGEL